MKIDIINPVGPIQTDVECEWSGSWKKLSTTLEPNELELIVSRDVPVLQYAKIIGTDEGRVRFLGYTESNTIRKGEGGQTTWQCYGMEKLLLCRFAPRYFWPKDDTTFSVLFADSPLDTIDPGLLMIARSAVPPGLPYSFQDQDANIVKLPGYGTNSYFGECDLYGLNLNYCKKLNEIYVLSDLSSVDYYFYRDTSDLYVRIANQYDRGWYDLGGLLAIGAYETYCRLGECPDDTIDGDLETDWEAIGDLMVGLARSQDYYSHVRYDRNYCYLDFNDEEGRA